MEKFIKEVIAAITRENDERKYDCDKNALDIPFIISVITQHIKDKEYETFLNDLNKYNFSINYEDINIPYCEDYGKLSITLFEENKINNEYHYSDLGYTYGIILTTDKRDWGSCECSPEDDDYKEDKRCCGHGCDWDAPAFRIIKEIMIGHESSWNGDQHDFWDFENAFYKSDEELAKEKEEIEKIERIKYLDATIKSMQEELLRLL